MSLTSGYLVDAAWRALLVGRGIRPQDVLRRASLPDDLLDRPSPRLLPDAFARFCREVEAAVADPLLAIWCAEHLDLATFSPALFVGLCSPDLRTAARRIAKFKPLVGPMALDVGSSPEGGSDLTLAVRWKLPPFQGPPLQRNIELLFFTQLARLGTRARVEPRRVRTPVLPEPLEAYEAFLGCPVEPATDLVVAFRHDDAVRPFLTTNAGMWETFEPTLRRRLTELEGETSFTERTRAILLESLPVGITDVGSSARRLGLSSRTLQRRLRDEGTSFKEVVRELREELSRHYLLRTRLTASEIAYLVGFDQPSSFFRAFQEWTGQTPESMRSRASD